MPRDERLETAAGQTVRIDGRCCFHIGTTPRLPASSRSPLSEKETRPAIVFFDRLEQGMAGETAPGRDAQPRQGIIGADFEDLAAVQPPHPGLHDGFKS